MVPRLKAPPGPLGELLDKTTNYVPLNGTHGTNSRRLTSLSNRMQARILKRALLLQWAENNISNVNSSYVK